MTDKKNFVFLTRHHPNEAQQKLAAEAGIDIVAVGDVDAFTVTPREVFDMVPEETPVHGVIVVHPSAALRLVKDFDIGVFENANRAAPGEPPRFEAKSLHIYRALDQGEFMEGTK